MRSSWGFLDLFQMFAWNLHAVEQNLKSIGVECDLCDPENDASSPQLLSLDVHLEDTDERLLAELAECKQALAAQPDNGALALRYGRLSAQLGHLPEAARTHSNSALSRSAPAPLVSAELAACEVRLERWAEGLAVLVRALAGQDCRRPIPCFCAMISPGT